MIMYEKIADEEMRDFAKSAVAHFIKHEKCHTFTVGDIEAGELFALRFGNDRVVVFRLDPCGEVINYPMGWLHD